MELSVIIPAHNEEGRIKKTLEGISEYLKNRYREYEVIIVDDGSTDGTKAVAEEFSRQNANFKIISNHANMGKGYSVKNGVMKSKGDTVLFTDADLSTPITELAKLEAAAGRDCDIAIGSRALRDSEILKRQSRLREYMGKTFNFLVRMFVMEGLRDTQCGFKLFERKAALDVFQRQRIDGFAFDAEILYIAEKLGYKIKAVPVAWANSSDTKVKIISSSLSMIFDLLKIRHLHQDL